MIPATPCDFVQERLELFLDGELTGSENLAFVTHLKECDDCAAHWADDQEISQALMMALALDADAPAPVVVKTSPPRRVTPSPYSGTASGELTIRTRGSWLAPVLSAVAASLITIFAVTWSDSSGSPSVDPLSPVEDRVAHRLVHARGLVEVRLEGEGFWLPMREGDPVVPGMDIRTSSTAEAIFRLGDGASFSMMPGSRASIGTSDEGLAVTLNCGQSLVDVVGGAFRVHSPVAELSGESASFAIAIDRTTGDETILVMRGVLTAAADDQMIEVLPGERIEIRRGRLLPPTASSATEIALLQEELFVQRERASDLSEQLADAQDEIERLRRVASELEAPAEPVRAEDAIRAIVEDYLITTERRRFIRVRTPDGFGEDTISSLRPYGPDVVPVISDMLASEAAAARRGALVALLGWLQYPESTETLRIACFDPSNLVRRAAVRVIAKMKRLDLVGHLLDVARQDDSDLVRNSAAYGVAQLGDERGLEYLIRFFYESEGRRDRQGVLDRITRIDSAELVEPLVAFLHGVAATWTSAEDPQVLQIVVRKLRDVGNADSAALLRGILDRDVIHDDLRRLVQETTTALER